VILSLLPRVEMSVLASHSTLLMMVVVKDEKMLCD
jgi:hypothetical protein